MNKELSDLENGQFIDTFTDLFFFDGASNVQKAGQVLMAMFPRTFCFHGGEHVVSLFFTDIARIEPVKVCYILSSIFNYIIFIVHF